MTGNLNMLMIFRDLKAAEDVKKKAELGWFDVEFTMYGCAYMNPLDHKMYYKVSPEAKDIYDFIERAPLKNIFPSKVICLTEKYPVPSGMNEAVAYEVKKKVAVQLKRLFPKKFFEKLYDFALSCRSNRAAKMLWNVAENLQGEFDEESLKLFDDIIHYAKSSLSVNEHDYERLQVWLQEERANMNDDCVSKDIFEKTMYGIAVLKNDNILYFTDARKEKVCERKERFEYEGTFVTPIFEKTYWYNYSYRLSDVIKDYQREIRTVYDKKLVEFLKALSIDKEKNISKEEFDVTTKRIEKIYGKEAAETFMRYGFVWKTVNEIPLA